MKPRIIQPSPAPATSRRLFLGGLGGLALGLTAFPLAGCFPSARRGLGASPGPDGGPAADAGADAAVPPLEEAEAGVLISEYLMENYAIFAYTAAAPALPDGVRPVAELFRDHHKAHQDHAGNTLVRRGVALPELPKSYDVTLPTSVADILKLALMLETQATGAYHAFVAQHGEPALRSVAASILACETLHAVALLQALGDPAPFSLAFATDLAPHVTAFLTPTPTAPDAGAGGSGGGGSGGGGSGGGGSGRDRDAN